MERQNLLMLKRQYSLPMDRFFSENVGTCVTQFTCRRLYTHNCAIVPPVQPYRTTLLQLKRRTEMMILALQFCKNQLGIYVLNNARYLYYGCRNSLAFKKVVKKIIIRYLRSFKYHANFERSYKEFARAIMYLSPFGILASVLSVKTAYSKLAAFSGYT